MRDVLVENQLHLVYQAQWHRGSIVSYEALLRQYSEGNSFPRDFFESLPLFQQHQISVAIIQEVIQKIKQIELPIAFNLPARLLTQELIEDLSLYVQYIDKGLLRCEIVEDERLQEYHVPLLHRLTELGISLVIDDLMEKFSLDNLRLLQQWDISCILKIERKAEYDEIMEVYRTQGYIIIQEGDSVILDSDDVLQTYLLSHPVRL